MFNFLKMLFYNYFDIVILLFVRIDNYAVFNILFDFDFIRIVDFIFYNFGDDYVKICKIFYFYYVFIRLDNDFIRNFLSDEIDFNLRRLF